MTIILSALGGGFIGSLITAVINHFSNTRRDRANRAHQEVEKLADANLQKEMWLRQELLSAQVDLSAKAPSLMASFMKAITDVEVQDRPDRIQGFLDLSLSMQVALTRLRIVMPKTAAFKAAETQFSKVLLPINFHVQKHGFTGGGMSLEQLGDLSANYGQAVQVLSNTTSTYLQSRPVYSFQENSKTRI